MRVAEPGDPAKSVDVGSRAARDRALTGLTVSSLMLTRADEAMKCAWSLRLVAHISRWL